MVVARSALQERPDHARVRTPRLQRAHPLTGVALAGERCRDIDDLDGGGESGPVPLGGGDDEVRAAALLRLAGGPVRRAVATSEIVQAAWERGAELAVHGWIYDLEDGLLRDLEVTVGGAAPGA